MSDRIECRKQRPGAISEGLGEQREHGIQRQVYKGKGSEAQGLERFRVGYWVRSEERGTCVLWYVK